MKNIPDGTKVTMNGKTLIFGETIFPLRESNDILDDTDALKTRLVEDGYLLIRNFYDRDLILEARLEILKFMAEREMLMPDAPIEEALIGPDRIGTPGVGFPNRVIQGFEGFLNVVNSEKIMTFFERLLGGQILSLDHKWLRAIPTGSNTAAHYDVVYMGAGTKNLYTVWTAFSDVPLDMGPLAVCLNSHKHEKLKATYGAADAHQDLLGGHFSSDPYEVMETLGFKWGSTPFNAGDIILFSMYFMHGSLDNASNRYRITSDTRYQLASEPPDERHMGDVPDVIPKGMNRKPMEEARARWRI
jgi:hypothetical protein